MRGIEFARPYWECVTLGQLCKEPLCGRALTKQNKTAKLNFGKVLVVIEKMATTNDCQGSHGAYLVGKPGPNSIYRMQCDGAQIFRHFANRVLATNRSIFMSNLWRAGMRSGLLVVQCLVFSTCAFAATPLKTEILLKNIPVRGAVFALADWGGYSMILSSELNNDTVSYSGRDVDPMKVARDLVEQRGLKWSRVAGINVFASACRTSLSRPPGPLNAEPRVSDKFSLGFAGAPLEKVLGPVANYLGLDMPVINLLKREVSIRVRDIPIKDVIAALSAAEALSVDLAQGKLLVSALPEARECERAPVETAVSHPPVLLDAVGCQRKISIPNSKAPCSPLEYIETDRLKMRGLLTVDLGQGLNAWALVATDSGYIYRVKKGEYVGTQLGLVTEIDKRGIHLMEIVKDANGYWVEQARLLAFE